MPFLSLFKEQSTLPIETLKHLGRNPSPQDETPNGEVEVHPFFRACLSTLARMSGYQPATSLQPRGICHDPQFLS